MIFHFILLAASSLTFLCNHQVSSCDLNCTDYPVFTPSRLVVKHGDPANATCVACQRDCNENLFDLEKAQGEVTKNGTTLLWTVDRLTEWDIFIMCYYNTDDGDQCCSNLELIVYQPPESVSISFVNHTGPMFEHQQYRLQCSVQDVAPVQNLTVTFYRGTKAVDKLQPDSEEKKAVNKTFTFNITASKDDDGALYWCEAKLELGSDGPQPPPVETTEKLTAAVYYAPELKKPENPVLITITDGDTLHLNCSSVGNPSPTYTWTLPLDNSSSYNGSIFTIKSVGFKHEGQYSCSVTNTAGTVTKEFDVDVQVNPIPYIIVGTILGALAFASLGYYCKRN